MYPLVLICKSDGLWLGDNIMMFDEGEKIKTTAGCVIENVVEATGACL